MLGKSSVRASLVALSLWALCSLALSAHAAEFTFDLRVEGGRVPESMRLIRVNQGDLVRLRWTTDRPLALHLHGYDVEHTVTPGKITEMVFSARFEGRFPLYIAVPDRRGSHSHDERSLVTVEVRPR
jgi:hypothetical protein